MSLPYDLDLCFNRRLFRSTSIIAHRDVVTAGSRCLCRPDKVNLLPGILSAAVVAVVETQKHTAFKTCTRKSSRLIHIVVDHLLDVLLVLEKLHMKLCTVLTFTHVWFSFNALHLILLLTIIVICLIIKHFLDHVFVVHGINLSR